MRICRAADADDLQSRGSANPRPHKMPSLSRTLDGVFGPGGDNKPDFLESTSVAAAAAAAAATAPALGAPGGAASGTAAANGVKQDPAMGVAQAGALGPSDSKPQASGNASSPSGLPPGPRAAPPVPGQAPPGASPPPPGPPPNPFARVQSGRVGGPTMGPVDDSDDSDSDDPLAALQSLPFTNSMLQAALGAGPSVPRGNGHLAGGGAAGGGGAGVQGGAAGGAAGGAGGGGATANGGLGAPLPSLQMIDSQQLDMVLGDNMILETSSLNTGLSYGEFGRGEGKQLIARNSNCTAHALPLSDIVGLDVVNTSTHFRFRLYAVSWRPHTQACSCQPAWAYLTAWRARSPRSCSRPPRLAC